MNERKPTKVVGRRVVALLIDSTLLTAINAAIFFALADKGPAVGTVTANLTLGDSAYSIQGARASLFFLVVWAIALGNLVVLPGLKGFTVGKALLGLRVVRDDGKLPPGVLRCLARWFLFIADAFPYVIPYLTGFIVAMVNKDNKRLGDMVAGTLVVRKDAVGQPVGSAAVEQGPSWLEQTRQAQPPPPG